MPSQEVLEKVLSLFKLKKWKIMLVFAVIAAVLAGGLFTVKDYKAYKASQNAEQGTVTEKVNVSENVKASVLSKIETIESYRKTIETYEYYYENSIKVKLDPNNIHQGIIEYLFAAADQQYNPAQPIDQDSYCRQCAGYAPANWLLQNVFLP